ncbi:MAG: histidine phosphatase family protein [Clostridia bacterium]|nr:histidine phosphatase family protein [Clostridia bacterium]
MEVEKGLCYGASDVPLASSFEEEKNKVIKELSDFSYDMVYSSPSDRCVKLVQYLNKPTIIDQRLKELNFGAWELKNWNHINDSYAKAWMKDYLNLSCPDGESFQDLIHRFSIFYQELIDVKRNAVIVSHEGIIRAAYHIIDGIPLKETFNLEIDYGSLHKFKI